MKMALIDIMGGGTSAPHDIPIKENIISKPVMGIIAVVSICIIAIVITNVITKKKNNKNSKNEEEHN